MLRERAWNERMGKTKDMWVHKLELWLENLSVMRSKSLVVPYQMPVGTQLVVVWSKSLVVP